MEKESFTVDLIAEQPLLVKLDVFNTFSIKWCERNRLTREIFSTRHS
jgi:hypothetical protein